MVEMGKAETIAQLLYKIHCEEPLTKEEQEVLSAWQRLSSEHETMYHNLLDETVVLEDLLTFISLDTDRSWAKIVAATGFSGDRNPNLPHENLIPPEKRYWKKWLAAAALVGIIGAGAWLWVNRHAWRSTNNVQQQIAKDIAPGGNKAVLTLANGSRIILTSIGKGTIAHQGNVIVSKMDSGRLAYKALDLSHNEILYNTLTTPKAGQFQLVLPDGTKVWLNNASSLRYPVMFGGGREVTLDGEAYFEAAKDPSKPFKVKVNQMIIEVLGTSFNISAYTDETTIKTTLLSGSIRVSHSGQSVNLQPGEQALLTNGMELTIKSNANLDAAVAWKNGLFTFDKANLSAVMRQLARWYDLDVRYKGNIPSREFVGYIERDLNLSQVLEILKVNNVHFKVEGRTVTILP